MLPRYILSIVALWIAGASFSAEAAVSGEEVYRRRCAGCHDSASERAPSRDALKQLSAQRILRTLDFGVMINVAYVMGRDEREAVANYLGVQRPDPPVPAKAYCSDRTVNIGTSPNPSWKGWGPDETNTRYARAGGLTLTQVGKLKLKWAYGFDGDISAFGAPTVLGGTIFIGSAGGAVQALSTESGCVKWLYQSSGPVRSGPVAVPNGKTHVLVFSDLTGWVYGLEAETGRQLWKKKVETARHSAVERSAAVDNGIVFVPAASWGRDPLQQPGIFLLHIPGQRYCASGKRRHASLEDLYDPRTTQANGEKLRRRWHLGTLRGRCLVVADTGSEARTLIRHDGR